MGTHLAKQISARIKAKNLSVAALEKEAGLKMHSVRNIMRGKSKKPSAEILQAVSDVLGCTVKDLLTNQEIFDFTETSEEVKDALLNEMLQYPDLLLETVQFVLTNFKKNKTKLSVQQVLNCVEEIYVHSAQKKSKHIDEAFGEWFINLASS